MNANLEPAELVRQREIAERMKYELGRTVGEGDPVGRLPSMAAVPIILDLTPAPREKSGRRRTK